MGAKFVADMVGEHLQAKSQQQSYLRMNYGIEIFCKGIMSNVIGQLCNLFVAAINNKRIFRHAILIVMDVDMANNMEHDAFGITQMLGSSIMWLAGELHGISLLYKERLQKKSKKENYPVFLWAAAPLHRNFTDNHLRC